MPTVDVSFVMMEPRSSCIHVYDDSSVLSSHEEARAIHYSLALYENKDALLNTLVFDANDVVERASPTSCLFTDLCAKTSYTDARKIAAEIKKMSRDSISSCAIAIEKKNLLPRRQRYVYGDELQYVTLYTTDAGRACTYDILMSGTFLDIVETRQ
jgi:hypothetical protein